jgi:hypothetical protein
LRRAGSRPRAIHRRSSPARFQLLPHRLDLGELTALEHRSVAGAVRPLWNDLWGRWRAKLRHPEPSGPRSGRRRCAATTRRTVRRLDHHPDHGEPAAAPESTLWLVSHGGHRQPRRGLARHPAGQRLRIGGLACGYADVGERDWTYRQRSAGFDPEPFAFDDLVRGPSRDLPLAAVSGTEALFGSLNQADAAVGRA